MAAPARLLILTLALSACGGASDGDRGPAESGRPEADRAQPAASSTPRAAAGDAAPGAGEATSTGGAAAPGVDARSARPRVVVLGDSLTAGLGLEQTEAYPALLQQKLDAAGLAYQVINAGVSGDTSAGGLSRLDLALDGNVRVLVVALGGNDGLRALAPAELHKNLSAIVERAQARGIRVLLAGMEAPPNFGMDYVAAFRAVYAAVAKQYRVPLLPFLLDGVAGVERLNQRDGIHPTAEGAQMVADHVWAALEPLVKADARQGAPK